MGDDPDTLDAFEAMRAQAEDKHYWEQGGNDASVVYIDAQDRVATEENLEGGAIWEYAEAPRGKIGET